MSLQAPIAPVGLTSACRTTPPNTRGAVLSDCQGCRKFIYVRYASVPLGEIAIAGKSGRSLAGDAKPDAVHESPPLVDVITFTRSFGPGWLSDGVGPSDHASTISSVASAPVGAPLAMSTVGNDPSRAPAWPSNVESPVKSGIPVETMCVTSCAGRTKDRPPSNERAMKIAGVFVCGS